MIQTLVTVSCLLALPVALVGARTDFTAETKARILAPFVQK